LPFLRTMVRGLSIQNKKNISKLKQTFSYPDDY
jgi:hypothetical protein